MSKQKGSPQHCDIHSSGNFSFSINSMTTSAYSSSGATASTTACISELKCQPPTPPTPAIAFLFGSLHQQWLKPSAEQLLLRPEVQLHSSIIIANANTPAPVR
ncbi:hypothetical protein D5086_027135 [Populus alba]|uniref:Uncharacterized protein n=1 Tax=Populus alba TaxID=43335 RepID=A0ACC4B4K1_POPAL